MKKIWQSELSSFNRVIAHNTFTKPLLTATVGIIDRTIEEIKEIDVRTRKQLTMVGNFHPNGDVGKLCLPRSQRARGLKMVIRMFESRVIAAAQYLMISCKLSNTIKFVYEQEQQNIRIKQKLLEYWNVEHHETLTLKYLSKQFMKAFEFMNLWFNSTERKIYCKSNAWILWEEKLITYK